MCISKNSVELWQSSRLGLHVFIAPQPVSENIGAHHFLISLHNPIIVATSTLCSEFTDKITGVNHSLFRPWFNLVWGTESLQATGH